MQKALRGSSKTVPPEYNDFQLCKFFNCLPSQLEKEDAKTLNLYSFFLEIEAKEQKWKDNQNKIKKSLNAK